MCCLTSSALLELTPPRAQDTPIEESYGVQCFIEGDDGPWLTIPNEHDSPLDTDPPTTGHATPSVMDSNSMDIDVSTGDADSIFMDVASSMSTIQQEEESSPRGIKRELDSPDEEKGRTKSRRRKGEPEPDYSAISRQKIKQNKRTGQACDRCKLRKLRCDPGPNGCLPCKSVKHPCQVTDRVTGETFLRGEAGLLKTKNESLKAKIVELEETIDHLRTENQSLQTQLFCYELMQAESQSMATGNPLNVSDVATPHDTARECMIGTTLANL